MAGCKDQPTRRSHLKRFGFGMPQRHPLFRGAFVSLATVDALVGAAERAEAIFDGLDQAEGGAGLLGTGTAADRAVLTNLGEGEIELGSRVGGHKR